jgi:hypothetical protein
VLDDDAMRGSALSVLRGGESLLTNLTDTSLYEDEGAKAIPRGWR